MRTSTSTVKSICGHVAACSRVNAFWRGDEVNSRSAYCRNSDKMIRDPELTVLYVRRDWTVSVALGVVNLTRMHLGTGADRFQYPAMTWVSMLVLGVC